LPQNPGAIRPWGYKSTVDRIDHLLKKQGLIILTALTYILVPLANRTQFYTSLESTPSNRPIRNVILICMDTVRYDSFWLPESRNLKDSFSKWGAEAIRFQNAQSTASWTVPAVASVMSGLYPVQHQAGKFKEPVADLSKTLPASLSESIPTLPQILRDRNFQTQAFVGSPFVPFLFSGNQVLVGLDQIQRDDEIVVNVQSWIDQYVASLAQHPFFLYLHFMAGHDRHWDPIQAVQSQNATLSPDLKEKILSAAPARICSNPDNELCLRYQAYIAAMLSLRKDIAQVLTHLHQSGLLDQTVVILFSDHGEEFEDHLAEEKMQSAHPEGHIGVGHGHSMYQEVLHVPLLIWHPSYSGRDITVPISLVDIAPTVTEWLSLKNVHLPWSGKSLAQIPLLNESADLRSRPVFSSGTAYGANKTAVLWKQWKTVFIQSNVSVMFNLRSDPMEHRHWGWSGPAFLLDQYMAQYNLLPTQGDVSHQKLTESELEMLRSIGYLGMGGEL